MKKNPVPARHRFFSALRVALRSGAVFSRNGYKYESVNLQNGPMLILCGCSSPDDPMLLASSVNRHVYFVLEDTYCRRAIRRFAYAPIPYFPAQANTAAALEIRRRLRNGAAVCLFPEATASGDGLTSEIPISVAKLVKDLSVMTVTYRIDGAYMTRPGWAKFRRKGQTYGHTVHVYTPAMLEKRDVDRIYRDICTDLSTDAAASMNELLLPYRGHHLAENLEKQLFLCPKCRRINSISTSGNRISCVCGAEGVITETGTIFGFDHNNVRDWSLWQREMIRNMPDFHARQEIAFEENAVLYECRSDLSRKKTVDGKFSVTNRDLSVGELMIPFDKIRRVSLTFDRSLAFGVEGREDAHFVVECEKPYCGELYLLLLKRFARSAN